MSKKYITAKEIQVSCRFDGQTNAVVVPLRKGAVIELAEDGYYRIAKPLNDSEKKVFLNETTLNAFKSLRAIVSNEAQSALANAKSGNSVELERKIIALVTENNSLKEENEELKSQVERLTESLNAFSVAAAGQDDVGTEDDEEEVDYESMNLTELRELAKEWNIDTTGMKKADVIKALNELEVEEDGE